MPGNQYRLLVYYFLRAYINAAAESDSRQVGQAGGREAFMASQSLKHITRCVSHTEGADAEGKTSLVYRCFAII